jgi:thioredoxin reductase (NADPH)
MLIVDPTQGREPLDSGTGNTADSPRLTGRVWLFSNSKPNATELLRGVAAGVPALHGAPLLAKRYSSLPAPGELLDQIVDGCDAVLAAIAD